MSNKRNASTPTGAPDKDLRLTNSFSVLEDLDDQWVDTQRRGRGRGRGQSHNVIGHPDQHQPDAQQLPTGSGGETETGGQEREQQTYSSILQRRDSQASQGSRGGLRASNMGERTIFVTPKPEGGMRDEIVIECQKLNDKPFKGTITFKEAKIAIFQNTLGYQPDLLHSIRTSFNGCPVLRFKLNNQINIDDLINVEHFELARKIPVGNTIKTDVIACRIMGIRGMQSVPNFDTSGNDIRWVKIEGCEYQLQEDQILDWLILYGEPLSSICEDIHEDSDSDAQPIGNGTYSVKMKLHKDIPQFLPMYGRRIRLYYKGISKLCTQCFGRHNRRSCANQKVPWINYIRDYMLKNEGVDEKLYGKWWEIIDKEFPGYFDQDPPQEKEPSNSTDQAMQQDQPGVNDYNLSAPHQQGMQAARFAPKRTDHNQQRIPGNLTQPGVELSGLTARGLSLNEARSYIKDKKEQAELLKRMQKLEATLSSTHTRSAAHKPLEQSTRGRRLSTQIGPSGSVKGRGGLSFN